MSYLDNNEIIYYCMLECSGDTRASTRKVAPIMDTTRNTAARLCVVVKVSELPTGDFRVVLALSHNFTHGEVLRLYHAQDYIKQLDHLDEENQQLIDRFYDRHRISGLYQSECRHHFPRLVDQDEGRRGLRPQRVHQLVA